MEEQAFLDQHVFKGLKKLKDGFKEEEVPFFSASDFAILLERAEYFGISIYSIEPWFEGAIYDVMTHENLKKKATDARWYTKAFQTFESRQAGMTYSARLKVSPKLLARKSIQ
jgi:hypothetical protein